MMTPRSTLVRSAMESLAAPTGKEEVYQSPPEAYLLPGTIPKVSSVEHHWVKTIPAAISMMNVGTAEKMLDIVIDVDGENTYLGSIPISNGALSRKRIQRTIERLGIDPDDIIDVSLQESESTEGEQFENNKEKIPYETQAFNHVDIEAEDCESDQDLSKKKSPPRIESRVCSPVCGVVQDLVVLIVENQPHCKVGL